MQQTPPPVQPTAPLNDKRFTFEEEEKADDEDEGHRHKHEAGTHGVVVVSHETDAAQRVAIDLKTARGEDKLCQSSW